MLEYAKVWQFIKEPEIKGLPSNSYLWSVKKILKRLPNNNILVKDPRTGNIFLCTPVEDELHKEAFRVVEFFKIVEK